MRQNADDLDLHNSFLNKQDVWAKTVLVASSIVGRFCRTDNAIKKKKKKLPPGPERRIGASSEKTKQTTIVIWEVKRLRRVHDVLKEVGIILNDAKCLLNLYEYSFLGFETSARKIYPGKRT